GSGKTPLVLWLADALRQRGFRPGIISRGYGGTASAPQAVAADSDPEVVGDEPILLARLSGCAVWVGRDRAAAAVSLLAGVPGTDLLIADDGLQHYRLARDVEIAVFDRRGVGNGWLMPAGPLREPVARLETVDAIVCNGEDVPAGLFFPEDVPRYRMELAGDIFYRLGNPDSRANPAALQGKRLHAVAGIGDPQRFFDHLTRLGLVFTPHPFPDHHRFTVEDLSFPDADGLLMTEKDAVKCAPLGLIETWVLRVQARLAPERPDPHWPELLDLVLEKLDGRAPA
ncbi:MAG: tetraacyldisaccharide 4'-kinase, partial [Rhodocyclaceae bacterium]